MTPIGRHLSAAGLAGGLMLATLPLPAHAQNFALDETDQAFRNQALQQVLDGPLGTTEDWSNIASGKQGTLKAVSDHAAQDGRICREITETVQDGADVAKGATVACHPQNGPWQVVQSTLGPAVPVPADATPYQAPADISADPQPQQGLGNLPVPVQVWINGSKGYNAGSGTTTVTPGTSSSGQ